MSKIHKYKEGLEFTIKNLDGIDNKLYWDDSLLVIDKLEIGDKVRLLYSDNSNRNLEYELEFLEDCVDELFKDEKIYSDYMTEDEIDLLIGNN